MDYLLDLKLSKEDLNYIKNTYNKKILSNIIYKKANVMKISNYLLNKGFDIRYLLLNRLDIFLIEYEDIKNRIDKCTLEELELLKIDFALFG